MTPEKKEADHREIERTQDAALLDKIIENSGDCKDAANASRSPLIGECLDSRHPVLQGRVLVRWNDGGGGYEKWLPVVHGTTVRRKDRVLILKPANSPESIVIGVVDGFEPRPAPRRAPIGSLTIRRDESIRVQTAEGDPILEIYCEDDGPVVKILKEDVDLNLKGRLRISAKSLELQAKAGEARIKASHDVVIDGENVNVNCEP